MKEKEIHNIVKQGVKSPSDNFTDNLMVWITLQGEKEQTKNWKLIFLSMACFLILIFSLFVDFPNIQYFNFTIQFSPVIAPILSILFLLYEFHQLFGLIQKNLKLSNNNMVQHAI